MQESNNTKLKTMFYNVSSSQKLLNEIDAILEKFKNGYSEFYKNNIGEIDKIKNTNLELYVMKQNSSPLGTCTIKLENNTYVMQKDLGNNNYFYLLFKKDYSVALPYKDEFAMKELYEKYPRFVPLSKKSLLEKIFEKNKELLKTHKITKNFFFGSKINTLASKLEELKIYDLSEALNFYKPVKGKKVLLRRVNDADKSKSEFYEEYENINEQINVLNESDLILFYSELREKISKKIDLDKAQLKKDDVDMHFITESESETLKCISTPKADYMLDAFFEKKLDIKEIEFDIYKGKLKFEKNINFTFQSPCRTLADLVEKLNSMDYYKSIAKNSEIVNYNKNEAIYLN